MSHEATSWAMNIRGLEPATKLILLVLADCHNPAQGCFPGQDYIVSVTEISERSVRTHLKILETLGHITRERITGEVGQRLGTRYHLAFENSLPATSAGRTPTGKITQTLPAKSSNPTGNCLPVIMNRKRTIPLNPLEEIGYSQRKTPPRRRAQEKPALSVPLEQWTLGRWRTAMNVFALKKGWPAEWGPSPDSADFHAPTELLELFTHVTHDFGISYLYDAKVGPDGSIIAATETAHERLSQHPALKGIRVISPLTARAVTSQPTSTA